MPDIIPKAQRSESESGDLGQHFIVGFLGPQITPEEERLLAALRPSGIILFGKNISAGPDWQAELQKLITRARTICERDDFFVSIDHEGGRVCRFPDPITRFPAARFWGAWAARVAEVMGTELSTLGFNLSFAPVLDVHSDEQNPVIGPRALSSDPVEVAALGLEYYRALESSGVLACGKHFPGHGATTVDSHFELPRLDITQETLETRELLPFQLAVEDGIGMIMSAHVLFPNLDPDYPATLSPVILDQLLRTQLGFKGVIITDDLEMKALAKYSPAEKAVLGILAGNDILLFHLAI